MKKPVLYISATLLLVLVGAVPISGFNRINVFYSPIFIVVGLLLALLPLFYQFKRRSFLRQMAYILTHYGVLLIVVGVILEFTPLKSEGSIQLIENSPGVSSFVDDGGTRYRLPFKIVLEKAETEYYPLKEADNAGDEVYNLFEYDSYYDEAKLLKVVDKKFILENEKSVVDYKDGYIFYKDGTFIFMPNDRKTPVKEYRAFISYSDSKKKSKEIIRVNHPIRINHYRVYLINMSDQMGKNTVTLKVRRNPGASVTLYGMISILTGLFLFFSRRPKKELL